jgi:NhaA family Na+:H+ antiporter
MAMRPTLEFLKTESAAGLAPVAAAAAALALANSPWADSYFAFISQKVTIQAGAFLHVHTLADWVKEGLMAVFFLIVGLEIKFEVLRGELSSPRRLALPLIAAAGGMITPALIYLAVNMGPGGEPQGWPLATATDIAFAMAALSIVATRLPPSLRLFLLTLAIADDLGAVGLIGVLYTVKIHAMAIAGAGLSLAALAVISRWKRAPVLLYAMGFVAVWAFTLDSGVDTSVAGVACALAVPISARRPGQESLVTAMMSNLHGWVAFVILPLFTFTAAGFSLAGMSPATLFSPLPLGVAAGLIVGKPLGVLGFSFLGVVTRLCRRPAGASWLEMLGVAMLCGIGFTMSLYLGALAFNGREPLLHSQVRMAVITGSLVSALAASAVLAWAGARRRAMGGEAAD